MKSDTSSMARRVLHRGSSILASPFTRVSQRCLGVICAVATPQPVLALTFDDGPDPESTPAVLGVLAKYDARATFFMVGELAARQPHLVRAAAEAGHAIANHSWSHLSFPLLTARERSEQLRRCDQALAPYVTPLFRPPYLHQSVASRCHALWGGYDVIGFNIHAEDWLPRPAEWMSERLLRQARRGSIVILHDNIYRSVLPASQRDRRPMLRALAIALERLRERFRFVTVPALLRLGTPLRASWYSRGQDAMQPALRRHLLEQRQHVIHPKPTT